MLTQNYVIQESQIYGVTLKMEIHFELENKDIDVVFVPDFRMPNHAKHTYVQWQLPNSPNSGSMDDVLYKLETEQPIHRTTHSLGNLRLLY